jgi:hypothetical protein
MAFLLSRVGLVECPNFPRNTANIAEFAVAQEWRTRDGGGIMPLKGVADGLCWSNDFDATMRSCHRRFAAAIGINKTTLL